MHAPGEPCEGCAQERRLGRRPFLGLLSAGLTLALAGCGRGLRHAAASTTTTRPPPVAGPSPILPNGEAGPPLSLGAVAPPRPGRPVVYSSAPPTAGNQIALTIDDGYCSECVAKYVAFAQSTGIHITFNPNGVFGSLWTPLVDVVRPLVATRQVQFGNHTWDHANLLTRTNAQIADELQRNEDWIQTTFGVTSRPWFRPPYGYYNARVEEVAAGLGFTNILMWNGTLGDATAISPQELLGLAQRYVSAGRIVLGHMNHPTVLGLFPQLQAIIAERGLQPVTLDEMFGTSRATG
jgi:peptidoglycan/xylan/chitin deacetylase (PgdA/CDA1 family)